MKLIMKPVPGSGIKDPMIGVEMRKSQLEEFAFLLRISIERSDFYDTIEAWVKLKEEIYSVIHSLDNPDNPSDEA